LKLLDFLFFIILLDKLHCMLYEFHSKKNATQATNSICLVYGDLDVRTVKDGLRALVSEILISMTRTVLDRPIESNDSLLEDPRQSTINLAIKIKLLI
jgi:hypothetical protein